MVVLPLLVFALGLAAAIIAPYLFDMQFASLLPKSSLN